MCRSHSEPPSRVAQRACSGCIHKMALQNGVLKRGKTSGATSERCLLPRTATAARASRTYAWRLFALVFVMGMSLTRQYFFSPIMFAQGELPRNLHPWKERFFPCLETANEGNQYDDFVATTLLRRALSGVPSRRKWKIQIHQQQK